MAEQRPDDQSVLRRRVTCNDNHHHDSLLLRRGLGPQGRADPRVRSEAGHPRGEGLGLCDLEAKS